MNAHRMSTLAMLVALSLASGAALAMDHPKTAEHPAHSEHPAKTDDLLAVASGAGDLKTFVAAVEAAGLTGKFKEDGPFTIFAPSDAAFARLPEGALDNLLKPANRATLAGVLAEHVVPGKILAVDVKTMKAANVSGHDLDIEVKDGSVTVDGAHVIRTDLVAGNGVIHVIDAVITPAPAHEHPASDKPKDHPAH